MNQPYKQMREEFERDLREGNSEDVVEVPKGLHNVQDIAEKLMAERAERNAFFDDVVLDTFKQHGALRQKQVGGDHYNKHSIQPWDIIDEWGLNFYEGNVLKYLLRRKGNRLEDLQKIVHYVEKMIELEKE